MPPIDLETLVCCGDGKVACETQISASAPPPPLPDSDLPPESFRLSGDAELDWVDRNAVYDRDNSTKGNSNPKSNKSISQRFSCSSKPPTVPLIGLTKVERSGYLGRSSRRTGKNRPVRPVLLVVRGGAAAAGVLEPSSPKVSCIGKVRSSGRGSGQKSGPGFLAGFFGPCCGGGDRAEKELVVGEPEPVRDRERHGPVFEEPGLDEPTGLGGLKRFSSGRRDESWGGDVEGVDGGRVEGCGAFDRGVGVWARRGVGPAQKVECERDLERVGPATV
ncbi:hypothetical protein QJS04_geneDACA008511 [Acorus gramineus]|uniref:Uncharacterized protein n=1 Tax=Acorus gramineus TaxID=55184 RepID=A0AAV9AG69_ACOGR|nr:hypothetical protein QJS04_geneDACA008511 [Acorus gramineus]